MKTVKVSAVKTIKVNNGITNHLLINIKPTIEVTITIIGQITKTKSNGFTPQYKIFYNYILFTWKKLYDKYNYFFHAMPVLLYVKLSASVMNLTLLEGLDGDIFPL
ncbi:hypothetical protein H70357_14240 [Paenibacillus sp. FSL H7-0357]|nr:hypothetical protein H70357_14240 [Paenibacillus sp. FSL H7-0357]